MFATLLPGLTYGDGFPVDKVYHPYVYYHEREIEFRSLYAVDDNPLIDGIQLSRLSLGYAFAERLKGEVYLIGSNGPATDFRLSGYELELTWQLTEQGEYFADWGALV